MTRLCGAVGSEGEFNDASEIIAGEGYDGGSGTDTLYANGVGSAVNLSGVTLTGLERI